MKKELGLFEFSGILFVAFLIGLIFPDSDQTGNALFFLGHRSIFTHSILLPYLLFYYFIIKKKNTNLLITLFIIGIFLGIGLHLSADLHPKGWRGYSYIKFLGGDLGDFSPFWIFINAGAALLFSASLLMKAFNNRNYRTSYLVLGFLVGTFYSIQEPYNNLSIFMTFTIIFLSTFYVVLIKKEYIFYPRNLKKIPINIWKHKDFRIVKKIIKIILIIILILVILFFLLGFFLG